MTRTIRMWLATVAVAAPLCALGQATGSGASGYGDFSVAGALINTGRPVEDVRVGWPDLDLGYTFNVSKTMDMGLRFGLLYGYEWMTNVSDFGVGLAFYAPLRFQLQQGSNVNVLVHVDPGIKIYTGASNGGSTQFGFMFPVGIVVGGFPAPHLEVGGGFDLNMTLFVTNPVNFVIAPMIGPYLEYHFVDPNVAMGVSTRFGAGIPTAAGASSEFAFQMLVYAGYRLF